MNKFLIVVILTVSAPLGREVLAGTISGLVAVLPTVNVPTVVNDITAPLPAPLSGVPAALALLNFVKGKAGDGVSISLPGRGSALRLGSDALPTYFTCQTPFLSVLSCHICNLDCILVHNTYGGICAIDSSTPELEARGFVCTCQDDRNANGTIATPVQQCGPILGPDADDVLDYGLANGLYARQTGVLCTPLGGETYDSAGCNSDCKTNHQYNSGVCQSASTIPRTANQTGNGDTATGLFCVCSG